MRYIWDSAGGVLLSRSNIPKVTSGVTKAAGFLYTYQNTVLLLKRNKDGMWGFPGGHVEDGEDTLDAAKRECMEEMQACPDGDVSWSVNQVSGDVNYTTYCVKLDEPFTPVLNDEHSEFGWFPVDNLPYPTILGAFDAIARLNMDELGIAEYIADGKFTSPQKYCNVWLYAIRITGTGVAYRAGRGEGGTGEFTFRPESEWVTPEFLKRCNGLPVVWEHPETPILTSEEFADRVVGTIFLPYEKDGEVWGIAKIYDDTAKKLMAVDQWSTSPGVLAAPDAESLPLESGETLLYEGAPFLLDHIAICEQGVWDKYGAPRGVETTIIEDNMAEKEEDRREEDKRDSEKVESVAKVDATEDKKDAECEMKDKKDADGRSLDDLYAKLEKLMGLVEGSKSDKKDASENEEFVPGEPLDAEVDKKDTECKADKKDESEDKKKEDEKIGGEKANEMEKGERKAEREEQDRKDAVALRSEFEDIKRRLDAVNRRTRELTDAERNEISEAEAKADSVAYMFGEQAPRPLQGEEPISYRRRAVGKYQKHSDEWKSAKLDSLSDDVFAIAERQIYKDAQTAARKPASGEAAGQPLRKVTHKDPHTGQMKTEYLGSPASFVDTFSI